MSKHWLHLAHAAAHGTHKSGTEGKIAAILLIVVGFLFAPMLIGIPIMLYGFYKLCK